MYKRQAWRKQHKPVKIMLVPTGLTIVERKDAKLTKQRNADNLPDVFMDADSMNVEQRYDGMA